jgi:hypothetical protein
MMIVARFSSIHFRTHCKALKPRVIIVESGVDPGNVRIVDNGARDLVQDIEIARDHGIEIVIVNIVTVTKREDTMAIIEIMAEKDHVVVIEERLNITERKAIVALDGINHQKRLANRLLLKIPSATFMTNVIVRNVIVIGIVKADN